MAYSHVIRVRYGDCDMQRVVFNPHYLTYCDDAIDVWFRSVLHDAAHLGFDYMVKTVSLTWHASLVFGETAVLDCSISRWGHTSFDVTIEGSATGPKVVDTARFTAVLTMVSVDSDEHVPVMVPELIRELLS